MPFSSFWKFNSSYRNTQKVSQLVVQKLPRRMNRRLLEAAQTGNFQVLHDLLKDDPLLLKSAALAGGDTPLHIASVAGHTEFVKEVIKLRPEYTTELNQDGLSPLHIASANGDSEIVKELLRVNSNLCTIKGRERRVALHYAAIRGKVHVLKLLLSACADSVLEVTARGETALHLALKNNQFEAFKFLVEFVKQSQKMDILNKKANQGDTILHLAVSMKQYEVVDLLFGEDNFAEGTVEVNSLNKTGLTPLDVLLLKGRDSEIEEMLWNAGARRAEDLQSLQQAALYPNLVVITQNPSTETSRQQNSRERPLSASKKLQSYFKYDKLRDSPSEVRNCLLVIAILLATATYQAVLSPPGGVWQDDYSPGNVSGTVAGSPTPHKAGQTVMGTHNSTAYGLFLIFNSIGFFLSLHMINFLTAGFPLQLELQISLLALSVTYDASMTTLSPTSGISLCFTIVSAVLPIMIPIATGAVRNNLNKARCTLTRVKTMFSA